MPQLYDQLDFDVRRTILLHNYIQAWGVPQDRKIIHKEGRPPIEIYLFIDELIVRFATIGLSAQVNEKSNKIANYELLFACGHKLQGTSLGHIMDYVLDISTSSIANFDNFKIGSMIPNIAIAPNSWEMKSIFVDEARAEPEHFIKIMIGDQAVEVLWLIPLHEAEYLYIKQNGISKFDERCREEELAVIDLNRSSFV